MKKFFAGLCASLLAATLLGLGVSWSAWHVLSQPDYIKETLRTSGIYQTFVDDLIKQKAAEVTASGELPADQPQVQALVKQALSPELLQTQTEHAIDGSFDFLQGKSPTLSTNIDLSSAKQRLADSMAQYTTDHLKSLPTCTAATMPSTTVDALQATCVPPGFDTAAAAEQARNNVLNGSLLNGTKLDASQVQTGNGGSLQEQLQSGPTWYNRVMWSLYLQTILAILLAAGLVLLSLSRRIGMRRVGVIALWTGAVNAGLAWLSSFGVHYLSQKLTQTAMGGQPIQQKVFTIVQGVVDDIRVWWLWYSAAVFGIGVVLLVVYRITRPTPGKQVASLAEEGDVAAPAATAAPPAGSDAAPAKKPRPPRRIQ